MKVAIVGLGVVGGSLAMGLKPHESYEVYGIDTDLETIQKATEMGIIIRGDTHPETILPLVDFTILCVYPDAVPRFFTEYHACFKTGSVVMDVTGIKTRMIEEIIPHLDGRVDFVFTHPMAGREKRGLAYASEKVNLGANFLITPVERNLPENLLLVEKLARDVGFGHISRITPQEHDEMIAYTSQLPHAIAVALMNSDKRAEETGAFIGDSFRDLTRIAAINEALWSELFFGNKDFLIEKLSHFEEEIHKMKEALVRGDETALREMFVQSTVRRERLQK